MMNKYLLPIWTGIKNFDGQLIDAINSFLKDYMSKNPPYFASLMPNLLRVGFYAFFLIIIFAFLKLWYHESDLITYILIGLLIISAGCLLGIFAGFIQLAFTF